MNDQGNSIVCICASHVNNVFRLKCLKSMIQSWNEQAIKCPLYISMSYNDAMKQLVERIVSTLKYDNLYITVQTLPLKQFEHYATLIKTIDTTIYKYVLFTDDDDLWHKNRLKHFCDGLSQLQSFTQSWLSLKVPMYVTTSNPNHGRADCFTSQDVDDNFIKLEMHNDPSTISNYITYLFKIEVVKGFLQECNLLHLQHKYCDMLLLKYVKHCKNGVNLVYLIENNDWMYYYRHNNETKSITDTKLNDISTDVLMFADSIEHLLIIPKCYIYDYKITTINNLEVFCTRTSVFTIETYIEQQNTYSTSNSYIDNKNKQFIKQLVLHPHFQNLLHSPVFGGVCVYE